MPTKDAGGISNVAELSRLIHRFYMKSVILQGEQSATPVLNSHEEIIWAIFLLFLGLRILLPKFLHFRKKIKFYF